jgi:hypothetical protein
VKGSAGKIPPIEEWDFSGIGEREAATALDYEIARSFPDELKQLAIPDEPSGKDLVFDLLADFFRDRDQPSKFPLGLPPKLLSDVGRHMRVATDYHKVLCSFVPWTLLGLDIRRALVELRESKSPTAIPIRHPIQPNLREELERWPRIWPGEVLLVIADWDMRKEDMHKQLIDQIEAFRPPHKVKSGVGKRASPLTRLKELAAFRLHDSGVEWTLIKKEVDQVRSDNGTRPDYGTARSFLNAAARGRRTLKEAGVTV